MSQQFGKYQLLRKIASGGMAEIFLAKQRGMEGFEKLVVIKTILPNLADNQEFVQMFLDEARIAAMLSHPYIVQIYDLGRANNMYFIAMEYVQGENLRGVVKAARQKKAEIPLEHLVKIISQACEGLHYAHTRKDIHGNPLQIVHRDISPQNILVSFDGMAKLVDFGIAKAATQYQETRAGVLKGKFSYMSPEQCLGKALDGRSDVFSMGIVLWELCTGRRLFKNNSELIILKEITEGRVPSPNSVNPAIPPALDNIILKALEKDPEHRFQSALHLHMALEDFLVRSGMTTSTMHIRSFMTDLFSEKLDSLRKIMQAQAAGESLESMLFDDLVVEGEGSTPVSGSVPGSQGMGVGMGAPVARPTTGLSRLQAPPARPSGQRAILVVLLVLLVAVLGLLTTLIVSQLKDDPGDSGLPVKLPTGKGAIHVISSPEGATVTINGQERCLTPCDVTGLALGANHVLQVGLSGHKPFTTPFQLDDAAEPRRFSAHLVPLAPRNIASLQINTTPPQATVELDGKPLPGKTPVSVDRIEAGVVHKITLSLTGHRTWSGQVTLEPEQKLIIDRQLTRLVGNDSAKNVAILQLVSKPKGASFSIDGVAAGASTVRLEPGHSYEIQARLTGYKPWSKTLKPGAGKRTVLALLDRDAPLAIAAQATLSLQADVSAEVYIDGNRIGTTPIVRHPIPSERITIRVVGQEPGQEKVIQVTAKPGAHVQRKVQLGANTGLLQVRANPWAHVSIRGERIGTTPFEPKSLATGIYQITFENPALGTSETRKVEIRAGKTTVVEINFLD